MPDVGDKIGSEEILIVEDDKFLRDLIVEKLMKDGFRITKAVDGKEAMEKLKESRPKLILLDLILPGIDGFEILRRLKADSELSKIPVLVLSNLGQQEDINRAKDLGAKEYLIKAQFTLGEIMEVVRRILRENYF